MQLQPFENHSDMRQDGDFLGSIVHSLLPVCAVTPHMHAVVKAYLIEPLPSQTWRDLPPRLEQIACKERYI